MMRLAMLLAALAAAAAAQVAEPGPDPLEPGVGRRLDEALGNFSPLTEGEVTLEDLGNAVAEVLRNVDRSSVVDLNQQLAALEREEKDLVMRLEDLRGGIPVPIGGWGPAPTPFDDFDEQTLDLEEQLLLTLEVRRDKLAREREAREEARRRDQAARALSRQSLALLASFDAIPPAPEKPDPVTAVSTSRFPLRMARALFRTGDFVGALRHFKALPKEKLTSRDRYDAARCLEETGRHEEAVEALDALAAATETTDAFWHQRAKNLSEYLKKSTSISRLLKKAPKE